MAISCWVGMLNFDFCCRGAWGVGVPSCWDDRFSWESCCRPEFEHRNVSRVQLEDSLRDGEHAEHPVFDLHIQSASAEVYDAHVHTAASSPPWMVSMNACLAQYDAPASRRWFLAHSGLPAHFSAHVGNPAACADGGHTFYWGLLIVNLNLAGNPTQDVTMADVAVEFGVCVPKVCEYSVVDAVIVPFYLGQYLGKPWGPSAEIMHRFVHISDSMVSSPANPEAIGGSAAEWMNGILTQGANYHYEFYNREWPFRREIYEYKPTWWPSPRNEAILACLALPPLVAGLGVCFGCLKLTVNGTRSTSASSKNIVSSGTEGTPSVEALRGERDVSKMHESKFVRLHSKIKSFVSFLASSFAPQTYIEELTRPMENDLSCMHIMRIIMQVLVCWQHAILFVEWLGNAGHNGVGSFLPVTNDVARVLGRVNTTFACVTTHLSFHSIVRLLHATDRRIAGVGKKANGDSTEARANDAGHPSTSSNGKKHRRVPPVAAPESPKPRSDRIPSLSNLGAFGVLCLWCFRRWVRQAAELALWTFYFNEITQDIPWKPFPDFVQVWYRDRAQSCRNWLPPHQYQLPMWLLSLLFVYVPVNSILKLHRPPVSLCHNMQVFENLFVLSVCGAVLGTVRYRFGSKSSLAAAAVFCAIAIRWDPPWPISSAADDDSQDKWDMVIYNSLQMLPAAVTTAMLLADVFPEGVSSKLARPRVALGVIVGGLVLDFICLGHAHVLADAVWPALMRPLVAGLMSAVTRAIQEMHTPVWFAREGIHALGVALLLRSFDDIREAQSFPGWARCVSRLSLSINLTNIFAVHYLRGRLFDHPVEFSHIHAFMYTAVAWIASVLLSLGSYCMVTPYVTAVDSAISRLSRAVFAPRRACRE